jgi:hypothetical protein
MVDLFSEMEKIDTYSPARCLSSDALMQPPTRFLKIKQKKETEIVTLFETIIAPSAGVYDTVESPAPNPPSSSSAP